MARFFWHLDARKKSQNRANIKRYLLFETWQLLLLLAPASNMRPDAQEEPNSDEAVVVSIAGDRAYLELDSVAVDWVHWRLGKRCNVCKRDFDYMSIGTHCRRCGQLYCSRCIPQVLSTTLHFLSQKLCLVRHSSDIKELWLAFIPNFYTQAFH